LIWVSSESSENIPRLWKIPFQKTEVVRTSRVCPSASKKFKAFQLSIDLLRAGQSFEAELCSFQKVECPKGVLFEMGKPGGETYLSQALPD